MKKTIVTVGVGLAGVAVIYVITPKLVAVAAAFTVGVAIGAVARS